VDTRGKILLNNAPGAVPGGVSSAGFDRKLLCASPDPAISYLTITYYFDTLYPVKSKFFAKEVPSNVNSFKYFRAVSAYERAYTLDLVPDSETMPTGALTPPVFLFKVSQTIRR
jgi:hypothetical protein